MYSVLLLIAILCLNTFQQEGLDFAWIDCCDELWVFMQDGWRDSYGVKKEIEYAKIKEMPIRYVTENNYMYPNERALQLDEGQLRFQ